MPSDRRPFFHGSSAGSSGSVSRLAFARLAETETDSQSTVLEFHPAGAAVKDVAQKDVVVNPAAQAPSLGLSMLHLTLRVSRTAPEPLHS